MENKIKDKVCVRNDCTTVFTPYRFNQKHCSKKCFYNDEREKPKKEKKVYKIPKKSEKRAKKDKIYLAKRIVFLKENQFCAVYPNKKATEVHHKYSGKDRDKYYLDETTWLAVSREGHNWIHSNPKEAREIKLLY
jgi:hypothetical protein